jgi:hypothetical protein
MKFTVNCELKNLIYTPLQWVKLFLSLSLSLSTWHVYFEMDFINLYGDQDTRSDKA